MDVDVRHPGVGSLSTPVDKEEGVKNWQNLADVFYGWPLTEIVNTVLVVLKDLCKYYYLQNSFTVYQSFLYWHSTTQCT